MAAELTSNYKKHTSKNPIQQFLINNFYQTLVELFKNLRVNKILDVGSGEGFTLAKLKEKKIGDHLEGIEYSKEAIEIGKKLYPELTLKYGSVYKLPYQDNLFDLVVSTEVLEHLENPEKALKEIIRVSKKYILLSVPNEPWFTVQRLLRGKNILEFGKHPEHFQYWTSSAFQKFIKKEKIKILFVRHPFAWTMVLGEKL